MYIDTDYLLDFGFEISDEISIGKLERSIKTAEQYIIKPRLGYELYADILDSPTAYETALNGGILTKDDKEYHVAGLKEAEAHLAYGVLLGENINATTFGTVKKTDDYSSQAGIEDIRRVSMFNTEIGLAYLKEITDFYGIHNEDKHLPNLWEELI